jgi:multiple sugar transport system substrate-binding protein
LGLAACGGTGSGGSASSPKPTNGASAKLPDWLASEAKQYKGRTLNVVASQQYFKTTNEDFVNACKTFGDLTGTTINVSVINIDTGNIVTREDAAVKAGNPPDCAFVDAARFVSEFYQLGDIVPVTDAVQQLESKYGAAHDVNKIYLQLGSKKDWYGIPYFSLVNGYFSRKDWLDAKGIKQSEFDTYEKMRDVALEISDPSQQRYGWGITYNNSGDGNGFIERVLNSYGAAVADDSGTKVIFGKGSETKEAVTFISDIYTNSKYSKMLAPGIQSWNDTSNNEAWLAGTLGFTGNAFSLYAQSKSTGNPVYHETLLWNGPKGPAVKGPINVPSSESFVIFKNAKEPGLAKVLAKYLPYGAPLLQMVKDSVGLVLPAYTNIWTSDPYYLNGDPAYKPQHQDLLQPLPIATTTGLHFPQTPSPGTQAVDSSYVLSDMIGSIVSKKASVNDAISTAKQRMMQIFEQHGLTQ